MQTLELKLLKQKDFNERVMFFVIEDQFSSQRVLGRKLSEWVLKACDNYSVGVVPCEKFELDNIKPYLNDAKYTFILSGGMILLGKRDVEDMVEYVTLKQSKACKLPGGYAFETDYLKKAKEIFFDSVYFNQTENLILIDDKKKLNYATGVLQDRIISDLEKHGVKITGNCYIEPDVEIAKGTIVFGGNTIKGECYVGENVVLKENNVLENVRIGAGSCVSNSTIINSELNENVFVKPYCYIEKCIIRKNTNIASGVELIKRKTRENANINKKEEEK